MTNATATRQLTGEALLSFIEANKDSKSKAELAQESGYVRDLYGKERVDFNGFYEAVLEAQGVEPITPNPYEGRDIKDLLLEKGYTRLEVSYDPNLWGFTIQDGNGDNLEDGDLEEHLQDELWDKLEDAVGNNIFNGVVNVSKQGLTFTGEVIQPAEYTDLSLR